MTNLSERLFEESLKQKDEPLWPEGALNVIYESNGWKLAVPKEYGGLEIPLIDRLKYYRDVCSGDLSTALILANRDSAIVFLAASKNQELKDRILSRQIDPKSFVTVGINNIGTRKSGKAFIQGDYLEYGGTIPWSSGAIRAEGILGGGFIKDGHHIMFWLDLPEQGIEILPSMELVALSRSCTSKVICSGLKIPKSNWVSGPAAPELLRRGPERYWVSSFMALGVLDRILMQADSRVLEEKCRTTAEKIEREVTRLITEDDRDADRAIALRAEANVLLNQAAYAYMLQVGGNAFVAKSVPNRLIAEAQFFGVFVTPPELKSETIARVF